MPCYHPLRAWRTRSGEVHIAKEQPDSHFLNLPCGNCLGCRMAHAKAWALRCQLELQQHNAATFATLTYSDDHLPATLQKRHIQLFLKRLRKATPRRDIQRIRFFASGEYGEQTQRPHYHAILYGIHHSERDLINETWQLGHTRADPVGPAAIAYVAGYTAKKIGFKQRAQPECIDPETGEVYTWQPPFIQMSRRPGLGSHAKQWPQSWRSFAIQQGHKMPSPRFLHEAWKQQATTEQLDELIYEKTQLNKTQNTTQLQALEKIAIHQQAQRAARRQL